MSTPSHIPVLHALNAFLKGESDGDTLRIFLTRNDKGDLILQVFDALGNPIEGSFPEGYKEVGETLRMMGRRVVREDAEADGWRAA